MLFWGQCDEATKSMDLDGRGHDYIGTAVALLLATPTIRKFEHIPHRESPQAHY